MWNYVVTHARPCFCVLFLSLTLCVLAPSAAGARISGIELGTLKDKDGSVSTVTLPRDSPTNSEGKINCTLKNAEIADSELDNTVDYVCSHGVDCAPIKPGGSNYPCSKFNCTDWAVGAYFEEYYPKNESMIDEICFFGGIAQPSTRPQHFYIEVEDSEDPISLVTRDNDISVSQDFKSLEPLVTYTYHAGNISLAYDPTVAKTTFQGVWVAYDEDAKHLKTCTAQVVVAYDFDGDGTFDRVETFAPWIMALYPKFENYKSGLLPAPQVSGLAQSFRDMKAGSVKFELKVIDAGCSASFLQAARNGPPASLTIPYK